MLKIIELDSQQEVNEYLHNELKAAYDQQSNEPFSVALSGGSTPLPFFDFMRSHTITIAQRKMNVFWVDERMVHFDDEWSNCYIPITTWLHKESNVKCFPVNTDLQNETEAAKDYENTVLKNGGGELDYAILGMGRDGHVASIFPRHKPSEKLVFGCRHPSDGTYRVSMGLPLLAKAKKIILLIQGKAKKQVLEKTEKNLPIHQLLQRKKITCLYID